MKLARLLVLSAAALIFASTGSARAETKVVLSDTHLCCGACVRDASAILKGIEGVTGKCDQKARSIAITAKDDATAQKAINALAAGGFHGKLDNKDLKIKEDSGVKKGSVKTLTITDVHNCCGQCTSAIKKSLKGVEGVKADTLANKLTTFDVTGEFDAEAVIKALNAAGFHAKVK